MEKDRNQIKNEDINQEEKKWKKKWLLLLLLLLLLFFGFFFLRYNFKSGEKEDDKKNPPKVSGTVISSNQSNGVWKDKVIIQIEEEKNKKYSHYEACIIKGEDYSKCEWKRVEGNTLEVTTPGENNVVIRGVESDGTKGEISNPVTVLVDKEGPKIEDVALEYKSGKVEVQITALDQGSGIDSYYYFLDDGEKKKTDSKFTISNLEREKEYILHILVRDKIGNETEVTKKVYIAKDGSSLEGGKNPSNPSNPSLDPTIKPTNPETLNKDTKIPEINFGRLPGTIIEKEDYPLPGNVSFGSTGGKVVCSISGVEYTSTKDLEAGVYRIDCEAVGNNGITSVIHQTIEVKEKDFKPEIHVLTEEISTVIEVEIDYKEGIIKEYRIGSMEEYLPYEGLITLTSEEMIPYKNEDGSLTIYARGMNEKGKYIEVEEKVTVLDLEKVKEPEVQYHVSYPLLKEDKVEIISKVEIVYEEDSTLENYYSLDQGKTWEVYEGPFETEEKTVLAMSVKESGLATVVEEKRELPSDALLEEAYDDSLDTFAVVSATTGKQILISDEITDKSLRIFFGNQVDENAYVVTYNEEDEAVGRYEILSQAVTVTNLEKVVKLKIVSEATDLKVSEIVVREKEIEIVKENPQISLSDTTMNRTKGVTITYSSELLKNEYSIDFGETWVEYEGPFVLVNRGVVFARSLDSDGKIVGSSSYHVTKIGEYIPIPYHILEGDSYSLDGCTVNGDIYSNTNELGLGNYHIVCKTEDDFGNIKIEKKTIQVIDTEYKGTVQGDSILQIVNENEFDNGYYILEANGETYPAHIYVLEGNTTFAYHEPFGLATDIGTASTDATHMVIVKVNGDLLIEEGVSMYPYTSAYGGPKGLTVFVDGNLINYGAISMSSGGAKAVGQDVYLYQNEDGSYETVPAVGASGAGSRYTNQYTGNYPGYDGGSGLNRQTGGGGSGGALSAGSHRATYSGAGGSGTSYSGGAGGGGSFNGTTGGTGSSTGGAGGNAYGNSYNSSWSWSVGAGTGNPGGSSVTGNYGHNGTGGLLTVHATSVFNYGSLVADGVFGRSCYRAAGAGSGGGSVNVFYTNFLTPGTMTANGGVGGTGTRGKESSDAGSGGNGTVTTTKISFKRNESVAYVMRPKISLSTAESSLSKTVQITYPGEEFTNEYSLDMGSSWTLYEDEITALENGVVLARSKRDGVVVSSSSQVITSIDEKNPTITLDIPNQIIIGEDYKLPSGYEVSTSESKPVCEIGGVKYSSTRNLEEGIYEIHCKIVDRYQRSAEVVKNIEVYNPLPIEEEGVGDTNE